MQLHTQSRCLVFSFSVKAAGKAQFGGSLLFFSLAMFSTVDGSCDSRSKVWFITEDVSIIDQTRGAVGTPLFGLAGYCVAEHSMPVFKALSLKQLGYTISLC